MGYTGLKPADTQTIAQGPADIRDELAGLATGQVVNAGMLNGISAGNESGKIPVSNGTVNTNLNADKLDGMDASAFASASHTHNIATTSSNGIMSNTDKAKLDGIAVGAQVNQNAFSNILVGSTTIQADSSTDMLEFVGGNNISITSDAINDRVTIAVTGTVPLAASSGACTGNAVTATTATNSNKLGGYSPSLTSAVSTAVIRDGSGDIACRLIRSEYSVADGTGAYLMGQNALGTGADNYVRPISLATLRSILGSMPANGGNSASVGGCVPGNSANNILKLDSNALIPATNLPNISEPIGNVLMWTSTIIPEGYLECNGQAVSRSAFSELYAKIGTTFGSGNGSTTFNIPDLRGEFLRGWDHGKGIDRERALGSLQSQSSNYLAEVQNVSTAGALGKVNVPENGNWSSPGLICSVTNTNNATAYRNSGNETRPRNIALMFIIKVKSVIGVDPAVNNANAATLGGFSANAFATSGHNHAGIYLEDAGHSFAKNGYQKLSNGLMIQWGDIAWSGSIYNFPVAFPNAVFVTVLTQHDGAILTGYKVNNLTKTGFGLDSNNSGTACYYIALGY